MKLFSKYFKQRVEEDIPSWAMVAQARADVGDVDVAIGLLSDRLPQLDEERQSAVVHFFVDGTLKNLSATIETLQWLYDFFTWHQPQNSFDQLKERLDALKSAMYVLDLSSVLK